MTSKEFVSFMKGMALGIEGTPTSTQWSIILKRLMDVKGEYDSDLNLINEIKKELDKGKEFIKKTFPGSPPDIFM
jgi:hypothetical protein